MLILLYWLLRSLSTPPPPTKAFGGTRGSKLNLKSAWFHPATCVRPYGVQNARGPNTVLIQMTVRSPHNYLIVTTNASEVPPGPV
ncbi:hypothetical protein PoB_005017400 [Plakobranchus ocellatus]|uniref:Secreted protein n=1 Tax=Plakobranchus ocellatus TaxID=259542 RepID=A0AAV4BZ60_9GAST|nr:hypothetical protein PoB_005017400 [Plakobranchus ocellatus]